MNRTTLTIAPLLASILIACEDPTEVVVVVDTSLAVPCVIDEVEIVVNDDRTEEARQADLRQGPVSLTVLREGAGQEFSVSVRGLKDGEPVATATATAEFVDETSLILHIVLGKECMDLDSPCDATRGLRRFPLPTALNREFCDDRYHIFQDPLGQFTNACTIPTDQGSEKLEFTQLSEQVVDPGQVKTIQSPSLRRELFSGNFNFRYYGEPLTEIWVGNDGFIAFGSEPQDIAHNLVGSNDISIVEGGVPSNAVFPFFDALGLVQESEVCVALVDNSAGEREFWVTWSKLVFEAFDAHDNLTFSVGLIENTYNIIFAYDKFRTNINLAPRVRGDKAIIGLSSNKLESSASETCTPSDCNLYGQCTDGQPCYYTQYSAAEAQGDWPLDPLEDESVQSQPINLIAEPVRD
ncbi:MAG: hypothetical protein KTR25_07080 [Myxococcales bacterium]|nr:hypothetical protein [Myxococcales bacterium]